MSCNQNEMNDVLKEENRAIGAMAKIPHKILVMSGKGGVGKTTVAVNLAYAFASMGKPVGIMDADMHGPNVALMTGIEGLPAHGEDGVLSPIVAARRVWALSIASFLPTQNSPVVWRGPRKSAVIRQFLGMGDWSKVEVLVADCPPGTGDEPMSVAQLIPDADGVVIVTSPQDVALLDSRKCVNFVREVNHKVLGIIENLSGYTCPSCGHEVNLFKRGGGEQAAEELGVPFLGRIPITPKMVESGDTGRPLVQAAPDDPAAESLTNIAKVLSDQWATAKESSSKDMDVGTQEGEEMKEQGSHKYVVIAAEDDKGLDGQVSGHFGRCAFYVVAEIDGDKLLNARVEENIHFGNHQPGQMPVFIRDLGADVILAGGMGPRAIDMFQGFGIEVATGAVGNVGRVLDAYLRGEIKGIVPCSHDHPKSCGDHDPGSCGHH
ncbi:MAG: P-loop NTPase [Proteobacteria bacterium]|nr:P-loop NTPase [Pseudomonadota bacterium]